MHKIGPKSNFQINDTKITSTQIFKTYKLFVFSIFQTTGMTPLMYAVKDNRITYLDRLIELGSDIGARNNVMFELLRYYCHI